MTRMVTVSTAVMVGILVPVAGASAQAGDQYNPLISPAGPTLNPAGLIAGGSGDGDGAGQADAVATETGSGDRGTMPFTGYPLTVLVILVGLALAGGIALRFAAPGLDRRGD